MVLDAEDKFKDMDKRMEAITMETSAKFNELDENVRRLGRDGNVGLNKKSKSFLPDKMMIPKSFSHDITIWRTRKYVVSQYFDEGEEGTKTILDEVAKSEKDITPEDITADGIIYRANDPRSLLDSESLSKKIRVEMVLSDPQKKDVPAKVPSVSKSVKQEQVVLSDPQGLDVSAKVPAVVLSGQKKSLKKVQKSRDPSPSKKVWRMKTKTQASQNKKTDTVWRKKVSN